MSLCAPCCRLPNSRTTCDFAMKKGRGLPSTARRGHSLAVHADVGHFAPATRSGALNAVFARDDGYGPPSSPRNFFLNAIAAPAEVGRAFSADNIAILYGEAGAEKQAAADCVQRTSEESGRSVEDYGRRALLFEQSAVMAASSKLKGDRLRTELELLQNDILLRDEGRSAADYLRRAELFNKSAEIFGHSLEL